MPSAIVPAAGSATRFGGGKLIADVGGERLLDRTLGVLLRAGIEDVVAVIPPDERWMDAIILFGDERVRTAVNPDPSRGMFSSIQIGARLVTRSPFAVLPGDMPFVSAETVRALVALALRTNGIVSPRFLGQRGHPIVLPDDLKLAILSATPTATLKDVLMAHADRFVNLDLDDQGVVRDVDVREDLAQ